jgi:hypothetical protein
MHGAFLLLQRGCKLWWDLGNEKDSLGENLTVIRRPCLYLSHSAQVALRTLARLELST